MRQRPPPKPPHPELERRPRGSFGWLGSELVHDGWLAELGPHATAILVLLAIAADRHGASFYSRERMASTLGMTRHDVDDALTRLLEARLVSHRPWRTGRADGVWQLLPPQTPRACPRASRTLTAAELLRELGFSAPAGETAE